MVEHGGDTGFTTVVVADVPCSVSLGVGVPYGSGILQLGSSYSCGIINNLYSSWFK